MNKLNKKMMHKYESELKEKEKAILGPLNSALKDKDLLSSKRSSMLIGKTFNERERQEYIDDLLGDLEEVNQEIIKAKSLKDVLPLLSAKYTIERTLISEERSILAEKRTLLSEGRTNAAARRTEFSEKRTGIARIRTSLAKYRTFLSDKRTLMSQQRTLLAKARTELAFIRTGMAFVALATGFVRYFGIGWWTFFDASLLVLGIGMIITGIYYYLPARRRETGLLKILRQKEEDLMRKNPRMLIIDDDPAICNLLKVFFKNEEYEVNACIDIVIAKQRLESREFDIVITGLMEDDMGDAKIVRTIHRLAPETPIIMISDMSPLEEEIVNIRDEIFDFFQKPLNLEALSESVKKALSKKILK